MYNEDALKAQLEFHPIANVFPLIEGDEFKSLIEDIREHGVLATDLALRRQNPGRTQSLPGLPSGIP